MKGNNFRVYIAIFFSMIFWGVSFIWTNIAFQNGYTPIMTVFFRLVLSGIFLISLNFWFKGLQKVSGKDLKLFFLLSFLQPFLYFLGESYGLTYVSATVAAVIIATIPLFSPIAAFFFFKEKISLMNILGISISILGVLLVMLKDDMSIKANPKGVICLTLAVFCAIAYSVVMVKLLGKFNVFTVITYQNILGVLWFLPAFLIFDLSHFLKVGFVTGAMVPIIGLSIFASSLAYIFFSYGVKKIGVVKANTLANIIPVITAISSFLFQDEKLTLLNTVGILIVVAGLFMSQVNQTLFARTKIILFMAKRIGNNQVGEP